MALDCAILVRLEEHDLEHVDRERGDDSRSAYLRRLIAADRDAQARRIGRQARARR
jgi:hypothetical protein